MMKRTVTTRVVEFDVDDQLQDDDSYTDSQRSDQSGGNHAQAAQQGGVYKDSSLTLTMTPTTRFLDQPILLDMAKDNTSTGSSTTLPGISGRTSDHGAGGDTLYGQYGPLMTDELLKVDHKSPNMIRVTIAGAAGLVLGTVLSTLNLHFRVQWWIGVMGYMYLCVLECLALPLIFTSVTLCVAQLVQSAKSKSILVRLGLMFVATAFLASAIGLLTGYAMSSTFTRQSAPPVELPKAIVALECPNERYLTLTNKCEGKLQKEAGAFTITNITGIDVQTGMDVVRQDVTFATQIVDFFTTTFQQNITEAFTTQSYLGVVVFAMFIGAGLVVSQEFPDMHGSTNYLFHVLKQVDVVLELILNWIIVWTPIGTFDGMTFTIMTGVVTNDTFRSAMLLPVVLLVALTLNFVLVVCVGYYVFVRKNPFAFFVYLLPALIYMLACQRYMATIPIMMRSVERSKQVSRTLTQFTISLGTALSMCGNACYFSVACLFMAYTSGLEDKLTTGRLLLLVIVSALSSFGAPQARGAALTVVATVWYSVFQSAPPDSLAFVVAMEWLTGRMRNVYNITVVAFIARVIAEHLDETAEDEEDRAMAATARDHEPLSPL